MDRKLARWAPTALALILVVGVAATNQQAAQGVALVNLQVVMQQTPGYEEALTTFQSEFAPFEAELQQMADQRDTLIAEYQRTEVILSPTARQEKQQEITALADRLQQRVEELQARQTERERELVAPLETRVQAIIEGVRAERNIGIVFDVATLAQAIAAVDQALDITPVVVQRLQQSQ